MGKFDFSGWATRNDLLCGDGRTIKRDAFKDNDGTEVPLVWNHQHNSADNVLGHALLENRSEGVYAYCSFNETESGQAAKKLVQHGDVKSLSIYANRLKQIGGDVIHGTIRELSLVLAASNPGATIDFVMAHSDDGSESLDGFEASYDENIVLYHADEEDPKKEDKDKMAEGKEKTVQDVFDELTEEQKNVVYALIGQALDEQKGAAVAHSDDEEDESIAHADGEKTVQDVFNELTEEQKNVVYALIGQALEEQKSGNNGGEEMKHNLFENEMMEETNVLCHSDEEQIIKLAKSSSVGSFQEALKMYAEDELKHGVIDGEVLGTLFPDYKDVYPGEPETLTDDESWVEAVISGTHKSPISRVRTRQLDARNNRGLRGKGYQKGKYKTEFGNVKLLSRTTDPQTIFVKDSMHRDDIVDFTDFDLVGYQWKTMQRALKHEIATAILIGDGRDDGDENKIFEEHIRPIWTDDELYTMHYGIDLAAAKTKIQGTDTSKHFSDNYIYAEALIEAALYSREKYKGSGNLTFYCTPHLINVLLLARDYNGRRIYSNVNDLKAALNVSSIQTVEQFEGLTRKDSENKEHKLLGMFVNLKDYQIGSTKGGEITSFDQFDIDFNQHKYLIETRISGALTRVKSAIVLEEPVED